MVSKKKSRRSVVIDTVPTPELKDAKLVPARLAKSRDAYYLIQGRRRRQIPLGPLTLTSDLEPLVGQPVTAVVSRKNKDEIIAIGTWPTAEEPRIKVRKVLCYVPVEGTLRRLRDEYRAALLDDLVDQGAITDELARSFRG